MGQIIVCNNGSDSLSKINTEDLRVRNIYLTKGENPFGPHGLAIYKDYVLCANNYNNSITFIKLNEFIEEKSIYIGPHPNDIAVKDDMAYVICGESDSLIIYDLINEKVNFEIPTGRFPHDITLFDEKNILFTSNMGDNTISVIDMKDSRKIKNIQVENTPLKIRISNNKEFLYLCMSYLGYDTNGYVGIISLRNLEMLYKVEVGYSPVDLFEDDGYLYVSNLCSESISIISLKKLKIENSIKVSGMPRGIIKVNDKLFISDYLNSALKIIDLNSKNIKAITVGKEPSAMTFIKG